MPAIALRGEIAQCHYCGQIAVLNGRGYCVECYDKLVDAAPDIAPEKECTAEQRRKYSQKYYSTHKQEIIRRGDAYQRWARKARPEFKARAQARERAYAQRTRHPCSICGKPCDRRALRCMSCYTQLLKTRGNREDHPWRALIGDAKVTNAQIRISNRVLVLASRRNYRY